MLRSFSSSDGAWPRGQLNEVTNGLFYGAAYWGGQNGNGTVFQITSEGQFQNVIQFHSSWGKGCLPVTGVTKGTDGNFYGITSQLGYTLYCLRPIEPPVLESTTQGDQVVLKCKAWGGLYYGVSYKTNLSDPNWQGLTGNTLTTNGVLSFSDAIDPNTPRFYRIAIGIPEHWW
jgi:uncharacterized repeat protein (TIGR03803 family)